MARLDSFSILRPICAWVNVNIGETNSPVYDSQNFNPGYAFSISTSGMDGVTEFDLNIQTSDSPTTGFTTVPASLLIGGAFPKIGPALAAQPQQGILLPFRGVLDTKRYIRFQVDNLVGGLGAIANVWILGAVDVAPDTLAEFDDVEVT
jgi:hypothetical protein